MTRNGNDWTDRLPAVAKAISQIYVDRRWWTANWWRSTRTASPAFPALQAALSNGRDENLVFYLFDLLHLDGWDLRQCALRDRKERLKGLDTWHGMLRYSDHHEGDAVRMRQAACEMKLEGIICKKADAPYRPGRGHDWLKVKCSGREEFLVLGWTEPAGSRTGLGALHLGYYDPDRAAALRRRRRHRLLRRNAGAAARPARRPGHARRHANLMVAGEDLERTIHWVKPELIAETSFTAWSGAGRVRHAVFLGLREDKAPQEVVRDPADPDAERRAIDPEGVYRLRRRRKDPSSPCPPNGNPTRTSRSPQPAVRS